MGMCGLWAGCWRDKGPSSGVHRDQAQILKPGSLSPNLQLQQLGPSQQNKLSCSSEAEEQRKTQEGTKNPCLCAWLVVEGELGVL